MRAQCSLPALFLSLMQAAFAATPDEAVPTGKLPAEVTPLSYALHLKIDPHEERFSGAVRIRIKLDQPADHLWLHGKDLTVSKTELVDARGKRHRATYTQRDAGGVAEIDFGKTLPAQIVELALDYTAPFSETTTALYKARVGSDVYALTQLESISARKVFPAFDEPRFKTPFEVTLTVPKDLIAVASTLPRHEQNDGRWKTVAYATTKPLPTYLIAFAVGPWDVAEAPPIPANGVRRTALPLRAFGPHGTAAQLKWILGETPAIVRYFEEYTNQPYPFDKLDLLGTANYSGAMENAGLIIFSDSMLLMDEHSPRSAYRFGFDVSAHEIAHQWFGDMVTVPWWNDTWLNEAFATWAQGNTTVALKPEYLGDLGRIENTLYAMGEDGLLSARKIRQPINEPGDIFNAFDSITYFKGAAVLRMFEEWLGEATYRKAMREYLARHAFGSGNSDDLIATIAQVSGKGEPVTTALRSFLDQPGVPLVHAELDCRNGKSTLALDQSRYLPYGVLSSDVSSWSVPVCVRFGRAGKSATQCFLLDRPRREFAIEDGCADWYLPNADAAGYYRFTMSGTDLAALRKQVGKLAAPEQMIFADAISSAFKRGDLSPDAVLDAMPVLASSELPQVAATLTSDFDWIHEHLGNDATRTTLNAYAMQLYGPRLKALGFRRQPGETDATSRLRAKLAAELALIVRDKSVRAVLDEQGRAALGLDGSGKVDLVRADPDLRRYALKVAVQESGEPAFSAALGELKTNHDTQQRRELLAALGSTHDPRLGETARNYALTPEVPSGEALGLYYSQVTEPENRGAFWQWYQSHYDAFVARMSEDARAEVATDLPAYGRCSKQESAELETFFAPRIKALIGGGRTLAQALERASQCAALREHVGDKALAKWVEAHPAP